MIIKSCTKRANIVYATGVLALTGLLGVAVLDSLLEDEKKAMLPRQIGSEAALGGKQQTPPDGEEQTIATEGLSSYPETLDGERGRVARPKRTRSLMTMIRKSWSLKTPPPTIELASCDAREPWRVSPSWKLREVRGHPA